MSEAIPRKVLDAGRFHSGAKPTSCLHITPVIEVLKSIDSVMEWVWTLDNCPAEEFDEPYKEAMNEGIAQMIKDGVLAGLSD